jgi:hypothetical protein
MVELTVDQYPNDPREYLKRIEDDGTLIYSQVGVEELDYTGRFGVKARSDTQNDISIGDKTFYLDEESSIRVGDDVMITHLGSVDLYMWGEVIAKEGEGADQFIRVYVDDISDLVEEGLYNWEIQVVARPKPGIEKDTSLSEADPTEDGPFIFEVTEDKFFPVGGQLLIKPTGDRAIALLGKVAAYSGTTLTVNKTASNAVTPVTYDSWSIALLDAPITYSSAYIEGLQISKLDGGYGFRIKAGSVMDTTGEVLLTLPQETFKSLNVAWESGLGTVGSPAGCIVQVPLSGTIGSSGTSVTGSSTAFTTDLEVVGIVTDYVGSYSSLINYPVKSTIYSGSEGRTVNHINNNTSITLYNSWTLSGGSSYGRNALLGSLPDSEQTTYLIYIVKNPTTGDVNISACSLAPDGNPDLPSGYTQWRLIASIECYKSSSAIGFFRLIQPRHAETINAQPTNFLNVPPMSVLGRPSNLINEHVDWIIAGADGDVLRRDGDSIGFGPIDTGGDGVGANFADYGLITDTPTDSLDYGTIV